MIHHSSPTASSGPIHSSTPKFRPQPSSDPIHFNHRYPLLGEQEEDINLNPETPPKVSYEPTFSYHKDLGVTTPRPPLRSSNNLSNKQHHTETTNKPYNIPHDIVIQQRQPFNKFRRRNQTRVSSTTNLYNYQPENDPSDLRYHFYSSTTTPTVYLPQRVSLIQNHDDGVFRVQHGTHAHSIQEYVQPIKRSDGKEQPTGFDELFDDFVESTKRADAELMKTEKPESLQLPVPLIPFNQPQPFKLRDHYDIKRDNNHALPRVIVSASATISDASGRKLNITLGEIDPTLLMLHDTIGKPPNNYDDYKESDVSLDPFYHDVPKVSNHKKRHIVDYDEYVNDNYEPDTYKQDNVLLLLEPAEEAIEHIENLTKSKYVGLLESNMTVLTLPSSTEESTTTTTKTTTPSLDNDSKYKLKSIQIEQIENKSATHNQSVEFQCFDKAKHEFHRDSVNYRVFHYCANGFMDSQLLHLQFMCNIGTYFNIDTELCENCSKDSDICKDYL